MQGQGVSLRIIGQPYLDIANGKIWKSSVELQLANMAELEMQLKYHLGHSLRLSNNQWNIINRSLEIQNLAIASKIYSPDGIMRRG